MTDHLQYMIGCFRSRAFSPIQPLNQPKEHSILHHYTHQESIVGSQRRTGRKNLRDFTVDLGRKFGNRNYSGLDSLEKSKTRWKFNEAVDF